MDTVDTYLEEFLIHLRIERNYSPETETSYRIALGIFLRFLTRNNLTITDKRCVAEFICHLNERGNCDITIAHRLTVLKSFFNYLATKALLPRRALPNIEKYKTTRRIISVPSEEEVNLFIRSIEEQYHQVKQITDADANPNERLKAKLFSLFRNLTFFTLITATGLRISEALKIQESDINWNEFSIKILGKGSKERLIYFGIDRLTNLLAGLREMKGLLGINSPYLFVSYQHKAPLTPRYVQKVMQAFLEKTSSSSYTPHALRHYYATSSIEKGANVKAVAVLLGHANISTTLEMYWHISTKYLKQVFELFNPFSNITLPVQQIIEKRYEVLVSF
jgi:integrase/recombinase XerC